MEDWELKAREQIRDLVARYNALGDSGRFDELLALFTQDARLEVAGQRSYEGGAEIRGLFMGAARPPSSPASSSAPGAGPEARQATPIWHHTATLVIELEDLTHATGRCYFSVLTPSGLDHWGRYRDRYRAEGGHWLFVERRIKLDGMTAGGWAERNLASLAAE